MISRRTLRGPRGGARVVWRVLSRLDRRILGEHSTRAAAEAQERAINLSRARAAGYDVPARPRKGRAAPCACRRK